MLFRSLSALKEESCDTFYVQGLLPPASPPRSKNCLKRVAVSDGITAPTVINKPAIETVETVGNNSLVRTKTRPRSVTEVQVSPTKDTAECPEITPSQAVNVEMLLELAGEDDISNISLDSQQMIGASGFCVDEQSLKSCFSLSLLSLFGISLRVFKVVLRPKTTKKIILFFFGFQNYVN